ncbi:hypothetical protein [Calothrix rhizosoleniae]|uniref:hypothetical protein n=1 Tax=Calothrix rhizosoleniae TaxID=888997 RepID=UPI00190E6862|nr:hypothetical protein [Calothrix rhizosoleniae]
MLTLWIILAAPLQSALMYQFVAVRNKPRLILQPEDFQSTGFSPCFGSVSPSTIVG